MYKRYYNTRKLIRYFFCNHIMKTILLIITICFFTLQCEQGWLKDILVPVVEGCTNSTACNYSPDATEDDGSCDYT